ncbi:MAG TPA: hypothetical protein VJ863_03575 [Sphaerochaeta sp.]|nr:hypothetical protein [Sphaerochaeta sp.]
MSYSYLVPEGQYFSICMVSALRKRIFVTEKKPYVLPEGLIPSWDKIVSPMREAYEKGQVFKQLPEDEQPAMELHYPLGTDRVEYSEFFMTPSAVDFTAQYEMVAMQEGTYQFSLFTCGAVKIFLGSEKVYEYYGYTRNQENKHEFSLQLGKKKQTLRIHSDDYAERDSQLYVRLQYCKGDGPLTVSVPLLLNVKEITEVSAFLEGVRTSKFNYTDTDIQLILQKKVPFPLTCTIKAGLQDAHIRRSERSRQIHLSERDSKIAVGDLFVEKVGMAVVKLRIEVGLVSLTRRLEFEYSDASIQEEAEPTIEGRKLQALHFIAEHGTHNLQKACAMASLGYPPSSWSEILEQELDRMEMRWDCTDFRLCALVWMYKEGQKNTLFPEHLLQRMKQVLLGYRYWYDEAGLDVMWFFSENHAINFHAGQLLAGELFPDCIFTNSGLSGNGQAKKATALIKGWFERFFTYGYEEWNSSVYIPIDLIAYFALFELAQDRDIRSMAQEALNRTFAIFAKNSFRGVMASSYGRTYFKNLIGRRTNEASALNFIAFQQGYLNQHTFSTTLFALSSYEVPSDLFAQYWSVEDQEYCDTAGPRGVKTRSFRTEQFILASAQNEEPFLRGQQEHMVQLMIGDCDTQVWINHPGERLYFGNGRPSYFAGNGTIPRVRQERNSVTLWFDLLDGEVDYTHAFVPLYTFDEVSFTPTVAFLRKGEVYLSIYAQNGLEVTKSGVLAGYELISPGKQNVWRLLVQTKKIARSFAQFIEHQSL